MQTVISNKDLLKMLIGKLVFIPTKPRKDMKGYSRSREDFRYLIFNKYKMREAIYIEGDSCSKCYMMKPHVQKWCEANGYEFQAVRFDDESIKQFDVQAVPMLVLRIDGDVDKVLNDEGIVNLVSGKESQIA